MLNRRVVIGLDTGNLKCGLVAIVAGQIQTVSEVMNEDVFNTISGFLVKYKAVAVVVEDIKPYAGNLSQQAIDTCKFIGQLTWRLDQIKAKYTLVTRSSVRKWVFDEFWEIVLPLVSKKIEKRNQKNQDGKNRRPSFVYVDDGMVIKAMRKLWDIPDPPPGKGYIHGLKSHTWQALALGSHFCRLNPTFAPGFPEIAVKTSFFGQPAA